MNPRNINVWCIFQCLDTEPISRLRLFGELWREAPLAKSGARGIPRTFGLFFHRVGYTLTTLHFPPGCATTLNPFPS
jgi:hypothetical protein